MHKSTQVKKVHFHNVLKVLYFPATNFVKKYAKTDSLVLIYDNLKNIYILNCAILRHHEYELKCAFNILSLY